MADFTTHCSADTALDARKRVNYELGMVLGEDEFRQEQWYLRARDHRAVRALHGYGTLAGLDVVLNSEGEIEVRPGLAVDPAGHFICVPQPQCADVATWVAGHQDEIAAAAGSVPTSPVSLWVELCYRECATDEVPVPSEDCRPASDTRLPSRILDSFELRLTPIEPVPVGELSGTGLLESIDRLIAAAESVPSTPSGDLSAIRAELIAWATELRPELVTAPCLDSSVCCLPLARIEVSLDATTSGLVVDGPPIVDTDDRPVLMSTRYLQEWLSELTAQLTGTVHNGDSAGGDLDGTYPNPQVDGLRGTPIAPVAPGAGQVLIFQGGSWTPAAIPSSGPIGPAGGDLDGTYPNPQVDALRGRAIANVAPTAGQALIFQGGSWTPAAIPASGPIGPAGGDLDGTYPNPQVDALRGRAIANVAPNAGQVLTFQGGVWTPANPATGGGATGSAGGDLTGSYPSPTVVGLQEQPVSGQDPSDGDVLTFVGGEWIGQKPSGGGGEVESILPFATITSIDGPLFQVWLHLDAPENRAALKGEKGFLKKQLRVLQETEDPSTGFLDEVRDYSSTRVMRNVYQVSLRGVKETSLLRFVFILEELGVTIGDPDDGNEAGLLDWAAHEGISFVGQDRERRTITEFVLFGDVVIP